MVAFGKKILIISASVLFLWLCVGYLIYTRLFQFTEENFNQDKPKSSQQDMRVALSLIKNETQPEQEIANCKLKSQKLSQGFWQKISLRKMEIPESFKDSLALITADKNFVSVQGTKVHYLYAMPKKVKSDISVLLLHGQSFTSETWNKIDTLRTLAAFGYYAVAVDLPGYGQSPTISGLNKSQFMDNLITALSLKKPVVVSPSMSGSFSLQYLIDHPKKLEGYIPVSPIHTNILSHASCPDQLVKNRNLTLKTDCQKVMDYLKVDELKLSCIKVPTLVVWGEKDRGDNSAKLCLLPNSQGAEIPNGRHPAYLSNPDLWHKLLFNFLNVLNETQVCRHTA